MDKSQLDANTFGVGQLITQRKLFAVPEHQRNFSWGPEEVEQYLSDISNALTTNAVDYFIGLIVIQGQLGNAWQILDGQQRLSTTIMVYSAIREWLKSRDYTADAVQIENEFIGVRQLGGKYMPRLQLNKDNSEIFERFVVYGAARSEFERELRTLPRRSSNRLLLEAALLCRDWVEKYCSNGSKDRQEQARKLFLLASYIETRVKVVCVEVSSITDAYILFESLNFRGADLSALDLVKNYIFSYAKGGNLEPFREKWEIITSKIEGKDADDFLKVFWTSRFGIIQKLNLFKHIREKYSNESGVQSLVLELSDASEKLEAIEDPEHKLWHDYGPIAKDRLIQLQALGNRQVRPVILSALSRFNPADVRLLLWGLIILIVRYQLIGRERTGILEKTLGRLAQKIWSRDITSAKDAFKELQVIIPDDALFQDKFKTHVEGKASRVAYLLAKIELMYRYRMPMKGVIDSDWRKLTQLASPYMVFPIPPGDIDESKLVYGTIGNYVLLEDELIAKSRGLGFEVLISEVFPLSSIRLTSEMPSLLDFQPQLIEARSASIAQLASLTWDINSPLESDEL